MSEILAELPQLDEHDRETVKLMLARARAYGWLEGVNSVHADIHMALADDTDKEDRGHINKWGLSRALRILETAIERAIQQIRQGRYIDG